MKFCVRSAIFFAVPGMAFLFDRATKAAARVLFVTDGARFQTGILDVVVHENYGIVANVPLPLPVTIALTAAVIVVIGIVWMQCCLDAGTKTRPQRIARLGLRGSACEAGGQRGSEGEEAIRQSRNHIITPSDRFMSTRCLALGLILGGAFSNLFDRVMQGFVSDWILLFGRAAVNAADIMIVFGVILLLVSADRAIRSVERG